MSHEPLPPSLRELERRLAARPGPEPAPAARARVLAALAEPPRRPRWRLAWRAAAAAVVALNLALSAANGLRYRRLADLPAAGPPRPAIGPAESDADERFQSVAASALSSLTPAPDAGRLGRTLFRQTEDREWTLP